MQNKQTHGKQIVILLFKKLTASYANLCSCWKNTRVVRLQIYCRLNSKHSPLAVFPHTSWACGWAFKRLLSSAREVGLVQVVISPRTLKKRSRCSLRSTSPHFIEQRSFPRSLQNTRNKLYREKMFRKQKENVRYMISQKVT